MVRFGGYTSDGVGFCLAVVLNLSDSLGGDVECVLARSPSEVGMVTPSGCFVRTCSEGSVGFVGIIPGAFACVMSWCVCSVVRGAVGVEKLWFLVVGVGAMLYAVVTICFTNFCNASPWHPWKVWFYFLTFCIERVSVVAICDVVYIGVSVGIVKCLG